MSEEIAIDHSEIISTIFENENKTSWAYFFPFVFSNHLPPGKKIYIYENSDLIFLFIHYLRNPNQIELFFPPLILNDLTIKQFNEIFKKINQPNIRFLWVDERDKKKLEKYFGNQIEIEIKSSEYIFDPKKIHSLEGSEFRDIRKKINFVKKYHPKFSCLNSEDIPEVLQLLKTWRKLQGRKNNFLLDWGYTNAAVKCFVDFDSSRFNAWKVKISSEIVGVGMAGKINNQIANMFIAKTNMRIHGVSEFLRWQMFSRLYEFQFVNDASDLGISGLKQHKLKFRPIEFQSVYTANLNLTV